MKVTLWQSRRNFLLHFPIFKTHMAYYQYLYLDLSDKLAFHQHLSLDLSEKINSSPNDDFRFSIFAHGH